MGQLPSKLKVAGSNPAGVANEFRHLVGRTALTSAHRRVQGNARGNNRQRTVAGETRALKMDAGERQVVHLLLRVPLETRVQGKRINTIEAHNEIIEKIGQVALAKFGQPGTLARSEKLKAQIERKVETLLILVVKRGARHFGYQSPLPTQTPPMRPPQMFSENT
jgi:hypothetical protein